MQFGLVKFGWELSGLVWFGIIWFGMDEFNLVWMEDKHKIIVRAQAQLSSLVYELVFILVTRFVVAFPYKQIQLLRTAQEIHRKHPVAQ